MPHITAVFTRRRILPVPIAGVAFVLSGVACDPSGPQAAPPQTVEIMVRDTTLAPGQALGLSA
ncbi:MAG: hypothetical protein P8177_09665, partial [Gemmatimonadota bacterium]